MAFWSSVLPSFSPFVHRYDHGAALPDDVRGSSAASKIKSTNFEGHGWPFMIGLACVNIQVILCHHTEFIKPCREHNLFLRVYMCNSLLFLESFIFYPLCSHGKPLFILRPLLRYLSFLMPSLSPFGKVLSSAFSIPLHAHV